MTTTDPFFIYRSGKFYFVPEMPKEPAYCENGKVLTCSPPGIPCDCTIAMSEYDKELALAISPDKVIEVLDDWLWMQNFKDINGNPHGHDFKEESIYQLSGAFEVEVKEETSSKPQTK